MCVGIDAVSHIPPLSLPSLKLPLSLLIPFPPLFDIWQHSKDIVGHCAIPLTPPSLALLYVKFKFDGNSKGNTIKEEFADGVTLFAVFYGPGMPPPMPPPPRPPFLLHCTLGSRQDGCPLPHLLLAEEFLHLFHGPLGLDMHGQSP
jgi:hypothetical protein